MMKKIFYRSRNRKKNENNFLSVTASRSEAEMDLRHSKPFALAYIIKFHLAFNCHAILRGGIILALSTVSLALLTLTNS